MQRIRYPHSPIASTYALSKKLQVPEELLLDVSQRRDELYHANRPIPKADGNTRTTFRLSDELKNIQTRIKDQIFNQVHYPLYLQGSIKDPNCPRTYDRDANFHAGTRLIISEDVSNYFHSIDEQHVHEMWMYLFEFPEEIAELLTRLTTYNGFVPQGGVTSSYLANLILWDVEPQLVEELDNLGLRYSRYIDDITMSVKSGWIPQSHIQQAISRVYGMLASKKLSVNRRKHDIRSQREQMRVHGLVVNSNHASLGRRKKDNIRLEVFNLEKSAKKFGRDSPEYKKRYNRIAGRVAELAKFNPKKSVKYRNTLKSLKPS